MTDAYGDGGGEASVTTTEKAELTLRARDQRQTLADVKETYREQATTMAKMDWLNRAFSGRYRQALFADATGKILDVACGVGTNAHYLPEDIEYVGIDISDPVLSEARQRLKNSSRETTLHQMDAQDIDFPDNSFDTVISSLSTCTLPNPVAALSEMARVCASDGQILLLEHGRSSVNLIARYQDWRADAHFEKHSCRWNQEPLDVIAESPLMIINSSTAVLGTLTAIEARPE